MKEIAKIANVSPATVSRTFHAPHLVTKETREKILQISNENHYVYNALAGSLSSQKSKVIGMLMPNSNRSFYNESLMAVQEIAQKKNYTVALGYTNYDKDIEKAQLEQFWNHQIAGLIATGYCKENLQLLKDMTASGIPSVITWQKCMDKEFSNVGINNYEASYTMTDYILSLGHKRVGLLIGPYNKISRIFQRYMGYKDALEKHNIDCNPNIILEREPTLIDGKEGMYKIMSSHQPPTAIFAASDALAIGAMAAARDMNLKIPEDISIAGFDDMDIASYCSPPLTTMQVPAFKMGEKAIELLLEMVADKNYGTRQYIMETNLIVRKSCAPPK